MVFIYSKQCLFENTATLDVNYQSILDDFVTNQLPGQLYSADDQCYIGFGTKACNEVS